MGALPVRAVYCRWRRQEGLHLAGLVSGLNSWGDVLAQRDARRLQANRAMTVAMAAEAEATRIRWDAEVEDAELDAAALEKARGGDAISERELRQARTRLKVSRANAQAAVKREEALAAELLLLDIRVNDMTIRAPFDGVVVSGDQSQNIGGAVRRGDVLFEIAPQGRYRVDLQVDERDIAEIAAGGAGTLVASAIPDRSFAIEVDRITPVAEAVDGANVFRVEARLAEDPGPLRPGMRGVVKLDVDRRLMIEIWTRSLIDWLRLTLWSWFG